MRRCITSCSRPGTRPGRADSPPDFPARGGETKAARPGSWAKGPAYDQVGKLAVMHAGRVKPLDTVAREEVKQVFGRETIKLHDAAGEVVETWGPVGAFLDWMVRPEFWDDQPFILVDYLPLRQVILADSIRPQLKEIAARSTTSAEDRSRAHQLWPRARLTAAALDGLRLRAQQASRGRPSRRSPSWPPSSPRSTSG